MIKDLLGYRPSATMVTSPSSFLGYLCNRFPVLVTLHAFLWLALVLNTVSLLFTTLPRSTEVILMFNYLGIGVLLLLTGLIITRCYREGV